MSRRRERPLTTALGWRLPWWLLDFGPVAFLFVAGSGAIFSRHASGSPAHGGLFLGLLAACGAVLVRHRAPLTVLGITLALQIAFGWGPVVLLPVLLAVFNVAEYSDRPMVIGATAVTAVSTIATLLVHHDAVTGGIVASRLVVIGLAVAVALYLRARADYINGLRERAERLERERELMAQQAVGDERVRIARELHDVVAHNVSLMVVQAQALAATSPQATQHETLGHVADLGREALSEMHRMLGVLRLQDGGAPELEPQPGVRDLPTLIERTRQAGLDAQLDVDGPPRDLPAAVDLSVYRIVQEALTNVVRHAHATQATVTLVYAPDTLEVTVLDDGRGANGDSGDGGHGLVGMRERVGLFGGELETGQRSYGTGFRVRALIPTH
ncbi:MAG TPA: sensor histidine kinase [Solirubrobacteraceae bacterium]|nr:sensor histidine kinase [Solirubrobacteraceae bacterium]